MRLKRRCKFRYVLFLLPRNNVELCKPKRDVRNTSRVLRRKDEQRERGI